ncbi:alpha/beta hydrolase [Actibacterium atlanticum]|uniref:Alpha/beta hydrolase n=1 Tax=Actibacterium atlanticum TaxID=1461693 RepID=A0A058ZK05_9RHOB|nr:alpha/beta hydrolase [Actibacterium atlanticum]
MEFYNADDGARIAYRITGKGRPLLCLAGLTRTVADFDYLAPHLNDVQMICMDYRGRGASQWTGAQTYSVPREAQDAINLLDHLGMETAPILGTSRGGLIALGLGATVPDRVTGVCFNDIGPVIERAGLEAIFNYVGRNPAAKTHEEAAQGLAQNMTGFANLPENRWMEEACKHYTQTENGLQITYDPALREAFIEAFDGPEVDLWPMFDALAGKPLALIRGANSDLLSQETADEMQRRRPDMLFANVPDRAHIPFLDEPPALKVIDGFLKAVA